LKTIANNKNLNDLGEADIIQFIQEKGPSRLPSHLKKGIGDDCAVLKTDGDRPLLVTTDTLVEGIHFTNQTLSPKALGWKALAVNVSDISAMGGTPHTAFLSLGIKPETNVSFIESFMAGFQAISDKTGIVLAGGDTVESPSFLVITVTLLGDCLPEHVVYRCGAREGDDLWVTGTLGNAAAGLFLLQNKQVAQSSEFKSQIRAHQKPMPPLEVGKALGESGLVHAMIDISDGIAKDLAHICEQSGVGAVLQAAEIPISPRVMKLAAEMGKNPLDWALHGGEDYELLFAASPADRQKIISLTAKVSNIPATRIGKAIRQQGIWLETAKGRDRLGPGGYFHFSRSPAETR